MRGFRIGDRVCIKRNHYTQYDVEGECGTVTGMWHDKLTITLDNYTNKASSSGVFYFRTGQLETAKEEPMEGMKNVVKVKFLDSDTVVNYASFEDKIQVGDTVVCKSANHGLGIAEVTEVLPPSDSFFKREIVCLVDMRNYLERKQARERKAELKQKMAKRASQLQEVALYKLLSKEDAEMAALLKEYKGE